MGKIYDIVTGGGRTRNAPDGSTLGLTTPSTWRGNTASGPAGGRATQFATTSPTTGRVSNVRNVTASDWKATAPAPKRATVSSTLGGQSKSPALGGTNAKTTTAATKRTLTGTRAGDVAGPQKDASGRNVSSATKPSKKKAGGIVKAKKFKPFKKSK